MSAQMLFDISCYQLLNKASFLERLQVLQALEHPLILQVNHHYSEGDLCWLFSHKGQSDTLDWETHLNRWDFTLELVSQLVGALGYLANSSRGLILHGALCLDSLEVKEGPQGWRLLIKQVGVDFLTRRGQAGIPGFLRLRHPDTLFVVWLVLRSLKGPPKVSCDLGEVSKILANLKVSNVKGLSQRSLYLVKYFTDFSGFSEEIVDFLQTCVDSISCNDLRGHPIFDDIIPKYFEAPEWISRDLLRPNFESKPFKISSYAELFYWVEGLGILAALVKRKWNIRQPKITLVSSSGPGAEGDLPHVSPAHWFQLMNSQVLTVNFGFIPSILELLSQLTVPLGVSFRNFQKCKDLLGCYPHTLEDIRKMGPKASQPLKLGIYRACCQISPLEMFSAPNLHLELAEYQKGLERQQRLIGLTQQPGLVSLFLTLDIPHLQWQEALILRIIRQISGRPKLANLLPTCLLYYGPSVFFRLHDFGFGMDWIKTWFTGTYIGDKWKLVDFFLSQPVETPLAFAIYCILEIGQKYDNDRRLPFYMQAHLSDIDLGAFKDFPPLEPFLYQTHKSEPRLPSSLQSMIAILPDDVFVDQIRAQSLLLLDVRPKSQFDLCNFPQSLHVCITGLDDGRSTNFELPPEVAERLSKSREAPQARVCIVGCESVAPRKLGVYLVQNHYLGVTIAESPYRLLKELCDEDVVSESSL